MNYYNEWDKRKAEAIDRLMRDKLIPKGEVDERSITEVQPSDLRGYTQCHFFAGICGWPLALQLASVPATTPLWTGSCPCQDYSRAGSKQGANGTRDLWPAWFRLIRKRKPNRIFGEQVESAIAHGWLDRLSANLEAEDYSVGKVVLGSHSAGGADIRKRVYVCAHTKGLRHKEQRDHLQVTMRSAKDRFKEGTQFVDAFRRNALPFLCRRHPRLSGRMVELGMLGIGDAINVEVAAEFIAAYMEVAG